MLAAVAAARGQTIGRCRPLPTAAGAGALATGRLLLLLCRRRALCTALLSGKPDRYGGVVVDHERLPATTAAFQTALAASVEQWDAEKRGGVWLRIPSDRTELVPLAIAQGFAIHHAQGAYVMLSKWLRAAERPSPLPPQSHHFVGVGGFVLDEATQRVLVIQERVRNHLSSDGKFAPTPAGWKVPGGLQGRGESLPDAVVREVWEETGVRTEFQSVFGFRHRHNYTFGDDDLYFFCRLRPLSTEIRACSQEVARCEWMPVAELLGLAQAGELFPLQAELVKCALAPRAGGELTQHVTNPNPPQGSKWAAYGTFNVYRIPNDNDNSANNGNT